MKDIEFKENMMDAENIDKLLMDFIDKELYDAMTLPDFVNLLGIEMKRMRIANRPDLIMDDLPNHWSINLTNGSTGKTMHIYFSGGSGVNQAELNDVVWSVINDITYYHVFDSAQEMADEFGDGASYDNAYIEDEGWVAFDQKDQDIIDRHEKAWQIMEMSYNDAKEFFTETQFEFAISGMIEGY